MIKMSDHLNGRTQMSNAPYQGQCLCGDIQYEADRLEGQMGHCHCTMCRKFHGAVFSSYGAVAQEEFRWLQGENLLQTYTAENGTKRKFCRECGSSMIFESKNDDGLIEFSLATLDVAPPISPDAHIYTGTKVDWFCINGDGLPKYLYGRS